MEQYISKSAIAAEIERRLKILNKDRDFKYPQIKELEALLSSLDTLLVKEVDLEKEIDKYLFPISAQDIKDEPFTQMAKCAKHFFELGLKAQKGEEV